MLKFCCKNKIIMKKIIVIKLGSNILMNEYWFLDECTIHSLAKNIFEIKNLWYKVVIVSSWAVSAWKWYLKKEKPEEMDTILFHQICSSLGQPILMNSYKNAFSKYSIKISQALFTQRSFQIPEMKKSMLNVLNSLIDLDVVPIINENDVLVKDEIIFWDNDLLSAYIWGLLKAEKVFLLSNIDGLFDKLPENWGKLIEEVEEIDWKILEMISDKISSHWTWGMTSKIKAGEFLTKNWIEMYILNWRSENPVLKILKWEKIWTKFSAKNKTMCLSYEK